MTPDEAPVDPTCERRVQAVLALFCGEPVTQVSMQYKVCRRDLYKFRRRALAEIRQALSDHRRGPRRPHNRLAADQEAAVVSLCERYPTWSSSQIGCWGATEQKTGLRAYGNGITQIIQ